MADLTAQSPSPKSTRPIMLRAPLTLTVICLIAATALASLDKITREKIASVRAQARQAAFTTLLAPKDDPNNGLSSKDPGNAIKDLALATIRTRKDIGDSEVVQAIFTVPDTLKLYILQLTGRGFGGPLELFAAYRMDGSLYHAIMLDNAETPGFGKKAEDPAYMEMFWDYGSPSSEKKIPTTKQALPPDALDAVTGSTISFSAISTALLAGAEWLVAHEGDL